MLIIHGENIVGSRNLLNSKIDEFKAKGIKDITRVNGKKVRVEEIKQSLESQSLFGSDRLTIIEGLIARPKSKQKDEIVKYLSTAKKDEILLWESKKLSKTQLKPFKNSTDQEFKTSSVIFKFLDTLGEDKKRVISFYQECINIDSPESIFFMIARQVRLLLQVENSSAKIPPWQKNKLKHQLKKIGQNKVVKIHQNLLEIDEKIKTGKTILGLRGELELLLARM
ncbi:hypothetical protein ACFL1M_01240 [Patescibacteria group bacterium]